MLMFIGCGNKWQEPQSAGSQIVVIDSCEYIVNGHNYYNNYAITHKGNCKFCEERKRKRESR